MEVIKAIVSHSSEPLAVSKVLEEIKRRRHQGDQGELIVATINSYVSDWLLQKGLGPDEVLAIFFRAGQNKLFTNNMIKINDFPWWIDDDCWAVAIHREGRVDTIARQILADYVRNFKARKERGEAPWGPLPKGITFSPFSPTKPTAPLIALGKSIDQAMLEMGLVYGDSLNNTWMPSLQYFEVSQDTFKIIAKLVESAFSFREAIAALYQEDGWARRILNIGRPNFVCFWAVHKKREPSLKIRLDIVLDQEGKPWITEIDGTPAGEGIHSGLRNVYEKHFPIPRDSFPVLETIENGYSQMAKKMLPEGNIMFLITDEARCFFPEQELKARKLKEKGINLVVCGPKDVDIRGKEVFAKGEKIVAWDRFVETYELNDRKLLWLAALSEKGAIKAFPPFSAFYWEGKETFALLHHPNLEGFWEKEMGESFSFLKNHVPITLFPDSPALLLGNKADWYRKRASQGDNLCWGSRGVTAGTKENDGRWKAQLYVDKEKFVSRAFPYHVYQKAVPQGSYEVLAYDRWSEKAIKVAWGVRLTIWGYYDGEAIHICDMLATLRNDPKIHGSRDSVQAPAVVGC